MTTIAAKNPMQAIERIREGLPVQAFQGLVKQMGMSAAELAGFLGLNTRTLSRKAGTGKGARLSATYSERVARLDRVLSLAGDVIGGASGARDWLRTPCVALGGAIPLSLLDTDIGASEVERVLQAIEWGVYL